MNINVNLNRIVGFIYYSGDVRICLAGRFPCSNEHMLDNEIGTDLTFLVGKPPDQQEIHAHKYVLVSRSPAFFSILHEDGWTGAAVQEGLPGLQVYQVCHNYSISSPAERADESQLWGRSDST